MVHLTMLEQVYLFPNGVNSMHYHQTQKIDKGSLKFTFKNILYFTQARHLLPLPFISISTAAISDQESHHSSSML